MSEQKGTPGDCLWTGETKPRMILVTKDGPRPIAEIAFEIRRNWKNVYFGAVPYLDAMFSLDSVDDDYGCDSGRMVVAYFLGNAASWRGEVARRVKKELKGMLK